MSSEEKTFTCESCGKTFPKGWTDEQAAAEAQELFPGIDPGDPDESGTVCDDCFEHIMARARTEAPELLGPGWRGEGQAASADPIGDALRADADAARAQIRAEGIVCPSCGTNMADLPDGHMLVICASEKAGWAAECRDGTPAPLSMAMGDDAAFRKWQEAATVAVWDDFRRREAESFKAIIGDGPGEFTGLIDILNAGDA